METTEEVSVAPIKRESESVDDFEHLEAENSSPKESGDSRGQPAPQDPIAATKEFLAELTESYSLREPMFAADKPLPDEPCPVAAGPQKSAEPSPQKETPPPVPKHRPLRDTSLLDRERSSSSPEQEPEQEQEQEPEQEPDSPTSKPSSSTPTAAQPLDHQFKILQDTPQQKPPAPTPAPQLEPPPLEGEPKVEPPVKPKVEEPVKPKVEEPVKQKVDEPVVEQPVLVESKLEQTVFVEPKLEEPVSPALEEPLKQKVDEPGVDRLLEPKQETPFVSEEKKLSWQHSHVEEIAAKDLFLKYGLDAWFNPERLHPKVESLVYWREPKKSGVVFGVLLVTLLSLTYFSLISVVAYLCLATLIVAIAFRIYKNVMQAVQKTSDGHPFKEWLEVDLTVPEDKVREMSVVVVGRLNCWVVELRRLFLVEDLVDSIKFAIALWALTNVGAWFNGLTLVIIGVVAMFTFPKVYENNKSQVDAYVSLVSAKISEITNKVKAAVPMGKKEGGAEKPKDQ